MAPHKTHAIVLESTPYQESSSILRLYTEELGLVSGIAKGIRRRSRQSVAVERGFLVESLVYLKQQRGLQTFGSIAVSEFYAATRADLTRAAVRDAALELALRTIHGQEAHPELFHCLLAFLRSLECEPSAAALPLLWRHFIEFATLLGFGPDLRRCAACGTAIAPGSGAAFAAATGGLTCDRCTPAREQSGLLPPALLAWLRREGDAPPVLVSAERRRVSRLLAAYCQHHFEMSAEYRSLDFLLGMT